MRKIRPRENCLCHLAMSKNNGNNRNNSINSNNNNSDNRGNSENNNRNSSDSDNIVTRRGVPHDPPKARAPSDRSSERNFCYDFNFSQYKRAESCCDGYTFLPLRLFLYVMRREFKVLASKPKSVRRGIVVSSCCVCLVTTKPE